MKTQQLKLKTYVQSLNVRSYQLHNPIGERFYHLNLMQHNWNLDEMLHNQHLKNGRQIFASKSSVPLSKASPSCHGHSLQNNAHEEKILLAKQETNVPCS